MIEGKGTNAEKSEAYFRLAFISNEKQAVPATSGERRFFALKVSDEYRDNTKYFKELVYEIEHGGAEAFMYHIEHLDISGVNLRKAPLTEALFEDIQAKMKTIEKFLYDLLHENVIYVNCSVGTELWGQKITKSLLFEYFKQWEKNISSQRVYICKHDITSQTKLVREINKIMSFKDIKIGTENGYELPTRDVARKMFESKVKAKVTWYDDVSDSMVDIDYELMNKEMDEIIGEDMKQRKIELEEIKKKEAAERMLYGGAKR
jgi:hypothetical protein